MISMGHEFNQIANCSITGDFFLSMAIPTWDDRHSQYR